MQKALRALLLFVAVWCACQISVRSQMFVAEPPVPSRIIELLADVDGDGLDDAIAVNQATPSLEVYLAANGLFSSVPIPIVTGGGSGYCYSQWVSFAPRLFAVGDFNGDGFMDFHCQAAQGCGFTPPPPLKWVVFGNGGVGPGVNAPALPYVSPGAFYLAADVDGNGDDELIGIDAPTYPGSHVTIVAADFIAGSWVVIDTIYGVLQSGSTQFGVGDFDGDGREEIFCRVPAGHFVIDGLETGTATTLPILGVALQNASLGPIDDVDADGYQDVVMRLSSGLSVFFGSALGLLPPVSFSVPVPTVPMAWFVGCMDVDQDGSNDMVFESTTNHPIREALVMRGLPGRQVLPAVPFLSWSVQASSSNLLSSISWGDIDGDGDVDLVIGPLPTGGSATEIGVFRNRSTLAPGCAGTGGAIPMFAASTSFLGNAGFRFELSGAIPGAPAALLASTAAAPSASCTPGFPLTSLVSPSPAGGWITTDGSGSGALAIPIPSLPSLAGLTVFAQWAVADPGGGASHGGISYALSSLRTLVVL